MVWYGMVVGSFFFSEQSSAPPRVEARSFAKTKRGGGVEKGCKRKTRLSIFILNRWTPELHSPFFQTPLSILARVRGSRYGKQHASSIIVIVIVIVIENGNSNSDTYVYIYIYIHNIYIYIYTFRLFNDGL